MVNRQHDDLSGIQIGELGTGHAFSDFQAWLKELKNRGILLAVCSKNNESTAKEPFEQHPEMVLRLEDFSMFVANWEDKASNIRTIQKTLNIGMDSLDFAIRSKPRHLLPEVDLSTPCTCFDNAAIVGDSIACMMMQCESKGDYLGNILFLARGGTSLNGFVRRAKNIYYQGREPGIQIGKSYWFVRKWKMRKHNVVGLLLFCGFLFTIAGGYLLPKAAFSDMEKRYLAQPPDFRWDTVVSGTWSSQAEEYLTDHVPCRNLFVGINAYAAFAQAAGREYPAAETFDVTVAEGFHSSTDSRSALWLTPPETIELWQGSSNLTVTNAESEGVHSGVFYPERLEEADKYTVFWMETTLLCGSTTRRKRESCW